MGCKKAYAYNDRNDCLYEPVTDENKPIKSQGQKLSERRLFTMVASHAANEVQYEA